jgi:hypothetical protein
MRSILVSADCLISLRDIAGPSPRGCNAEVQARLRAAVAAATEPRLSFAGVDSLGAEFVTRCLAPVLFNAARAGRPAVATEIDREVAQQLHVGLRSVGALLHHSDTAVALGASSQLAEALAMARRGSTREVTLAAALGISQSAAAGRLDLLARWGMIARDSRCGEAELALAA